MTLEENKAIVRDFWNKNDSEGKIPADLCASGFIAHVPGSPPLDLKAFQKMVEQYSEGFSNYNNVFEDMVAEDDKVAFRFERKATHSGEFMGIPSSGKQISWTTIGIARLADGKIAEFWNSPDQLGFMQQIGALPKPTSTTT